ncbi:MAG: cytidylate kinase-like family protein [Bacteroidota bacterium]
MNNLLLYYIERGKAEEQKKDPAIKPIVTISREFGCPSKLIAQMLTDAINKKLGEGSRVKWKFINKEVLESAAKELQLNAADVKYLLAAGEKGLLEDFLVSFSPSYVSNLKVKHTLIKVVTTIAQAGHVVLVGRGGAAILQGMPGALHVRLQAPLDWRVEAIISARNVNAEEARKIIMTTDKKRAALYELILGKKLDPYMFDAEFNCATLSVQQIVHGILAMMEAREML